MTVIFYVNQSDNKTVSKSLINLGSYDVSIKDNCTVQRPVITINSSNTNLLRANYAYIQDFDRFYYIDPVEITPTFLSFTLITDVLMSARYFIKGLNTYIDRQEYLYNLYIADSMVPVRSERAISYLKIGSLGDNTSIILTVTGNIDDLEGGNP